MRLTRRLLAGSLDVRGAPRWVTDSSSRRNLLSVMLAARGHLAEAYELFPQFSLRFPDAYFNVYAEMALLGGVPAESAAASFERALADEPITARLPLRRALLWWLARGDTVSLTRFATRSDSAARAAQGLDRRIFLRDVGEARAYLTLIRGDSAAALRQLQALGDSVCVVADCRPNAFVEARLLSAFHRPREAAALLDRYFFHDMDPLSMLAMVERARLAETVGERDRAGDAYQFVLDTWRNADPGLQPYITEAREALQRLGRERAR